MKILTEPELPPVTGQLDPKIAPLVKALRAAGYPTSSSCDGDGDGFLKIPWVNIECRFRIEPRRGHLIRWLRRRNIIANVVIVNTTLVGEPDFPFIRVEIFSDLSEADL